MKKLLVLTNNLAAKIGIVSYISSIFKNCLEISSARITQITPEDLSGVYCILYSSCEVQKNLPFPVPESIVQLVCKRTLNHNYLQEILEIPPNSSVYLVNDTERTAREVIAQLIEYGFSQYHFFPWWPGCPSSNEEIRYAVTPGEAHLAPDFIHKVIDIRNRIVDLSTINEIITCFGFPISLADEITKNYLNHIVQMHQLTNRQETRILDLKMIVSMMIENSSEGLCLLNESGTIFLVNTEFRRVNEYLETQLTVSDVKAFLRELAASPSAMDVPLPASLHLWVQHFGSAHGEKIYLIHTASSQPPEITEINEDMNWFDFSHFSSVNPLHLQMLEKAKRFSLHDFPIVIQGETGTQKEQLAQSIHRNSKRRNGPFVTLNISAMTADSLEARFLGAGGEQGIFSAAKGGTLVLSGLEHSSMDVQLTLCQLLKQGGHGPMVSPSFHPLNLRVITLSTVDLYDLVCKGLFLGELFFLLNHASLNMIPLRSRREDIPNLAKRFLCSEELSFTESLSDFLMRYEWPGNIQEFQNLCRYFSCLYSQKPLTLNDLPDYILSQLRKTQPQLTVSEKQILILICDNPKIGRSKIQKFLESEGIHLSEGAIRNVLSHLASLKYIRVHRTRGGCEATEYGQIARSSILELPF